MTINNDPKLYPFMLAPEFVQLLNQLLTDKAKDTQDGVIFNFRDPRYSPENGGFHPVEISISAEGVLQYVTDFAYCGVPPMAELVKELDFDFSLGIFQQFGREQEIAVSQGLFALYARNFCAYHDMGVYEVSITPL